LEVLRLAVTGESNKWIGRQLGIAEQTVKNHCYRIYDVLRLPRGHRNKAKAILEAVKLGQLRL
jgi:DNA-binding CsgD family transcriptional regulator